MQDKKPIYDERVNFVIAQLLKGIDREAIAKELKYTNYKSLDIYMRRKNFRWNQSTKNYVPDVKIEMKETAPTSSKAKQVISLLSKEGSDPKTIAKRLGYKDHIQMAAYMKAKGYVYDDTTSNYIKEIGIIQNEDKEDLYKEDLKKDSLPSENIDIDEDRSFEEYKQILDILLKNQDRLIDLLMPQVETGKIPRYVIGGTFVTKSVHMSSNLDNMIRDFSVQKGISQREIFEVALIEFFKRYGYEAEVQLLINHK